MQVLSSGDMSPKDMSVLSICMTVNCFVRVSILGLVGFSSTLIWVCGVCSIVG